jgi:hypothetical protein
LGPVYLDFKETPSDPALYMAGDSLVTANRMSGQRPPAIDILEEHPEGRFDR